MDAVAEGEHDVLPINIGEVKEHVSKRKLPQKGFWSLKPPYSKTKLFQNFKRCFNMK